MTNIVSSLKEKIQYLSNYKSTDMISLAVNR